MEIAEEDKRKTAFRDVHGELWEFNQCGFGLKTIPSGFAAYVSEALGPLKGKGVQNWLDDIISHTKSVKWHVEQLEKGTGTASPVRAVGKLSQVHMVRAAAEIRRHGYRQAGCPTVTNEDRRGSQTLTHQHRRGGEVSPRHGQLLKELCGWVQLDRSADHEPPQEQAFRVREGEEAPSAVGRVTGQGLAALVRILTSPPILALPDWGLPFRLHTDASELGTGAALTQNIRGAERVIGYSSHCWSRGDAKRSLTEREIMAVLWAIKQHRPYLWGKRCVLITDCSDITWLFTSQTLSTKLHRWALRLMEYDMNVQWRPGVNHQLPDALFRLPIGDAPGSDVDDSSSDDSSTWTTYRGPQGPVLDGVLLSELGAEEVDTPVGKTSL